MARGTTQERTQGAVAPSPLLRALSTVDEAGMFPISKICVQR